MYDKLVALIMKGENEFSKTKRPIMDIEKYVADYLIENGVIVGPCKIGQTVYLIAVKRPCFACWGCNDWCHKDCKYTDKSDLVVKEATVEKIEFENSLVRIKCYIKENNSTINNHDDWRTASDFGKTVFLTRKEAKQALEGTKEN